MDDVSVSARASASANQAKPVAREESQPQRADKVPVNERQTDSRVGKLETLQKAADRAFSGTDVKLSISYDEVSGRFIYRRLSRSTGEVVREYPPEEVLERMARRDLQISGAAVDRKL